MNIDPKVPREIFGWKSPRLGIDMPIVRYGTWGRSLLLFPTAQSDFLDNERFWLIKAIERHILAGRVNVFCIGTVNAQSWMDKSLSPREMGRRQALYAGYVEEEVVPHIRRCLGDSEARIGVSGASFGGFHAANTFFRRPDLFDTLIAMSGFYELWPSWLHGYSDENIYLNNPMQYVRGFHDPHTYELLERSQIHILSGQGAYEKPEQSREFSTLLWNKGIWNNLDLWGHDVDHDWPTWRAMLDHYIDCRLGW